MPEKATKAEPAGFDYKSWYEKNKEEVAKRRKKRYDEDEEYRKKRQSEASRYYWLRQRRAKSVGLNAVTYEELDLKPDSYMSLTVEEPDDIRCGMTFEVPVFYAKQVADVVRRTTQTLRLWFMNGYLLDTMHRDARGYRLFTEDQMRLFAENRHWLSFSVKKFNEHPFFVLVNEGLELMGLDGIEPMLQGEWRFDPAACPFCGRAEKSIQHKVDGKWRSVSCLICTSPADVRGRQAFGEFLVTGECRYCGQLFEYRKEALGAERVKTLCPFCSRDVPAEKVEVRKIGECDD